MFDKLKQILRPHRLKNPHLIKAPSISFIGEQDGVSEQELKQQLREYFQRESAVFRAYLVLAKYGAVDQNVVLCVAAESTCHPFVVKNAGEIFRRLFNQDMHLDILFVDSNVEQRVQQAAKPFFVQIIRKT